MIDYGYRIYVLENTFKTQKEFAKRLGISPRSVRRYKERIRTPRRNIKKKINKMMSYLRNKYCYDWLLWVEYRDEDGNLIEKGFQSTDMVFVDDIKIEKKEYVEKIEEKETEIRGVVCRQKVVKQKLIKRKLRILRK